MKQDAKRVFGDKVITSTTHRPVHSGGGGREKGGKALQLLFAEQLTLALCDYFVISHDSHVGRLAIWMSEYGASRNRSFITHGTKEGRLNDQNVNKVCHPSYKHADDSHLADEGAGI